MPKEIDAVVSWVLKAQEANADLRINLPEAAHSSKMMSPETVAQAVVDSLSLPEGSVVEEIKIRPITGTI